MCEVFCHDEEKVKVVREKVNGENFSSIAGMLKALADETRLKIAFALSQEKELCVCDIAHIIGTSMPTASHHLRLLKSAGIAKSRKEGKLVFYTLKNQHVSCLIQDALNQNEILVYQ
ncbi:metalloregulator ArsR/SmtB family transcription factor [Alkalihalobacillus sp. FSL R5-0424]